MEKPVKKAEAQLSVNSQHLQHHRHDHRLPLLTDTRIHHNIDISATRLILFIFVDNLL